jgi:hypothetical protein
MEWLDLIGDVFAVAFTIMVLLYAFGDNPLFRLAIHIFIGVAAGYAGGVAFHSVIGPHLFDPLFSLLDPAPQVDVVYLLIRIFLVLLLLAKISPRTAVLGNPATAFLVGIGAAVAIGGAVQGTIFPLIMSSANFFQPTLFWAALGSGNLVDATEYILFGVLALVGTVSTLVYFHFGARGLPNQTPKRSPIIRGIAWVGQLFISITFGVLFASVYVSALTALVERMDFLWKFLIGTIMPLLG